MRLPRDYRSLPRPSSHPEPSHPLCGSNSPYLCIQRTHSYLQNPIRRKKPLVGFSPVSAVRNSLTARRQSRKPRDRLQKPPLRLIAGMMNIISSEGKTALLLFRAQPSHVVGGLGGDGLRGRSPLGLSNGLGGISARPGVRRLGQPRTIRTRGLSVFRNSPRFLFRERFSFLKKRVLANRALYH